MLSPTVPYTVNIHTKIYEIKLSPFKLVNPSLLTILNTIICNKYTSRLIDLKKLAILFDHIHESGQSAPNTIQANPNIFLTIVKMILSVTGSRNIIHRPIIITTFSGKESCKVLSILSL